MDFASLSQDLGLYLACGNRCAFHWTDSGLNPEEARRELIAKRFGVLKVDVATLAWELVGKAKWKWAARSWDAPNYFDCSSLVKWLYAQKGIWIPRRAQQQFEHCGAKYLNRETEHTRPGNLLFVSSPFVQGMLTQNQNSLHVCLVVPGNKVICATNSEFGRGVVEVDFDKLLQTRKFRGVGNPLNGYMGDEDPLTLVTPKEREIETSDDVRWMFSRKS